jgi:hypothetical protein
MNHANRSKLSNVRGAEPQKVNTPNEMAPFQGTPESWCRENQLEAGLIMVRHGALRDSIAYTGTSGGQFANCSWQFELRLKLPKNLVRRDVFSAQKSNNYSCS